MKKFLTVMTKTSAAVFAATLASGNALATAPCGDFGECKALIEINSSDGDIGFHFLMDGDDLNMARIYDADGKKIFEDQAKGHLKEQKLTETFAESAEPLCWADPEADEDEMVVTLEEFLARWPTGDYLFIGHGDGGEKSFGETELTFNLPAAPTDVEFDGTVISWAAGDDLGQCATSVELDGLVEDGILPMHPMNVEVDRWEIVLEPDVEDDDPSKGLKYTIRVAGDFAPREVSVPGEYLASLPDDTPVKIEVGAIGSDANATFTEADGLCVNEVDGCDD